MPAKLPLHVRYAALYHRLLLAPVRTGEEELLLLVLMPWPEAAMALARPRLTSTAGSVAVSTEVH